MLNRHQTYNYLNLKKLLVFAFAAMITFVPALSQIPDGDNGVQGADDQTGQELQESKSPLDLTNGAAPPLNLSNISEDVFVDYLDKIVRNIIHESSVYDLIGFSIGMVAYGIFIFHFYRFLAKRDMFSLNIEQRLTGGKFKASGEKVSAIPRIAAYITTNIFVFPIVVSLWFVGYSSFMFFLAQDMSVDTVFLVSSSLIIAIRIAAYYNEDLSKDLAKLLPFALLGIFLLSPTFFSLDEVAQRLSEIPNFVIQIAAFIVVAIAVETSLSILYLIKVKFFGRKEKKSKISDSEHPV